MRLLLVEDEAELGKIVRQILIDRGFTVDLALDLSWAKEAVQQSDYDLVVLDRRLPDGDGKDLVTFSKCKAVETRFLFLSALGDLEDRVYGLESGGDDYMVKPFEPDELVARIHALLRRPLSTTDQVWSCGHIELDVHARSVKVNGNPLIVARRELSVLECLVKSAGRVVTRERLEDRVYGFDELVVSNTLESHISRLRKTLIANQAGVTIRAIRGVGYVMSKAP